MSDSLPEDVARAIAGPDAIRCPCPAVGCDFAVYARPGGMEPGAALVDHLQTDPRHTDGEWIDRDGNERRGLRDLFDGELRGWDDDL